MSAIFRLWRGPPAYPVLAEGQSELRPLLALSIGLLIFATALVSASLAQSAYVSGRGAVPSRAGLTLDDALVFLITLQATITVLTLLVAGWSGALRRVRLYLVPPAQGGRVYAEAFVLLAGGVALYEGAAYLIGATDIVSDLKLFSQMAQSPYWLAALISIGVGAPLSEELLFRGFLLPALANSPLRFRGSALLTTVMWTSLHASYSVAGLVEVALVGLFLAWVVWRTGSVLVTIACHAIYNTALMLALMVWPVGL